MTPVYVIYETDVTSGACPRGGRGLAPLLRFKKHKIHSKNYSAKFKSIRANFSTI